MPPWRRHSKICSKMIQRQSYDSVIFRHDFNIYEMRVMMQVVKASQQLLKNKERREEYIRAPLGRDGVNVNFAVPLSSLLGPKTHNYDPLKKALKNMMQHWIIEYWDREKGVWRSTSFLYNVSIEERSGLCRFSMAQWLIGYLCDFRRGGFRQYDYEVSMSFRNSNTARLYLLTASMTKPIFYPFEELKKILGVVGKYQRAASFVQRILDPAAKELEDRGLNGFRVELVREFPNRKRSAVKGFNLIPLKRGDKPKSTTEQKADILADVPASCISYLARQLGFSFREIKNLHPALTDFVKMDGWEQTLASIGERSKFKHRTHGWIVRAIRGEVKINKK